MSHAPYEPAEGVGRGVDQDPTTTYEVGTEVVPGNGAAYGDTYVTPVQEDLYAPLPEGGSSVEDTSKTSEVKDAASDVKDTAADQGRKVADTAKEQASQVKDTAVEQGQQVAAVAKDEAIQVKEQATSSLKDLFGQSRSELVTQAGASQNRLAEYVHSLADELGTLASKSDASGPITDLAHRGARTGGEISHWLSEHEPSDLLAEVTSFARRRPFAFLGASLLAGVVVGRVTRSLAAEAKDEHEVQAQSLADPAPVPAITGPDYAAPVATPVAPVGYATNGTTDGYAPGYVPTDLPESPAPQTWTGGAR